MNIYSVISRRPQPAKIRATLLPSETLERREAPGERPLQSPTAACAFQPLVSLQKGPSRNLSICGYCRRPDASTFGDAGARREADPFLPDSLSRLFISTHRNGATQHYWACSCYA